MSLHCVGSQNVRTATGATLNGATTASVSLWVQLNAGSRAPTSDAVLLGKSNGDPVSVVIVGGTTTVLRARWYANNGGTETGSSCDILLTSGTPTHLAMTYAAGLQQYFVNGILVQTDACASPLGRPADHNAPQSFQVGPDVAGLDVTLDEPTIWQGYALTQADVINLLNRVVHPNGIAPGQIAWGLSLAGNDGTSAVVGDAGLADLGPSGQSITAVSAPAPSYAGGVLSYTPAVRPASVKVGPSNQSIVCTFSAADGSSAALQSLNPTITKTVWVSGASGTFTLTVNGQTTAPIAIGADAGTVQAAIAALPGIGAGNVQVNGLSPYLIAGAGSLAGQPLTISINASGVSPSFAAVPGPATAPGSGGAVSIFNTDPACVLAGNWARANNNPSGTNGIQFTSDRPGPLTPCTATYTFSGVAAGTYDVFGSWPAYPSNASRAPYRIYDGTTLRAVPLANQQVATILPAFNNFTRTWLARVYCASGTLKVVLSNDADAPVVADAMAISPVAGLLSQVIVDDNPDATVPNGLCTFAGSGWQLSDNGTFGYERYSHGTPNPSDTATWQATWLAPGTYDIQAYWNAWTGYSPVATYTVYDGNTPVGMVSVNQQVSPVGGYTTPGSLTFQSLGTFTITGGTGKVVLTGGIKTADAILFKPTGATPPIGTTPTQTLPVTASIQSYGGQPTISINGGAPITLALPSSASNSVFYPLTSPVPAGATVTFSAPTNWALTSAGGVPASAASPVTTGIRTLLSPFNASTPKTMQVGYHPAVITYTSPTFVYANLMKQASRWNTGAVAADANGWPTAAGVSAFTIVTLPPSNFIDGAGIPNAPFGPYTIMWDAPDGAGNCTLSSGAGDSVFEDTSGRANLSATTDRTRVFVFQGNPTLSAPSIFANATGRCTNIRVYPPGAATDGSQLFHPEYLAQLGRAQSLRTSGMVTVNTGNVVDYADFPSTTRRTYTDNDSISYFGIASISPTLTTAQQTAAAAWFPGGRQPFAVTTTAPHNFKTGHVAQFRGYGGDSLILHLHGGSIWGLPGSYLNVLVTDSTTFLCTLANNTPIDSFSRGSDGDVYHDQTGSAPEHTVALANAVGNTTLHFNVPQAASDACCTQLFTMIAANLDRRCKLRVELSNEPWNFAPPYYTQYDYFTCLGISRGGLTATHAYVQRASEVHALAVAAFVAAGRPASDVTRMFNTIRLYSAVSDILTYAANPTDPRAGGRPIPVDEIACACYFNIFAQPSYGAEYDFLTIDQVMDVAELALPGSAFYPFSEFRGWVDSTGFRSTRVMAYEAGPASLFLGGSNPARVAQSQGASFHPRMYALMLQMLQESQDGGCTAFTKAGFSSALANDVSPPGAGVYGTYEGWDQPAGIGDGSDGTFDNRPALAAVVAGSKGLNYAAMASPVGGAINRWNALLASQPNKVLKKPAPTRAGGPVSHPGQGRRAR